MKEHIVPRIIGIMIFLAGIIIMFSYTTTKQLTTPITGFVMAIISIALLIHSQHKQKNTKHKHNLHHLKIHLGILLAITIIGTIISTSIKNPWNYTLPITLIVGSITIMLYTIHWGEE
ncbi:hypothetical protein K9L67_01535 [Candidatus Woesearchaeota archaeon]|nr:hypothetical protein [Candidatus Woesearchaeota archaeon]MCF7900885.1 hypothetical protein [Candidatus Woesearchaeota archaeon]MCF8013066.1 hypothetical protein [Candidatus Woesearchaeota archaeon]